ncbi:microcystin-dependent protein [Aneurinibacillus soli]|uniref:Phage Tail Collar Domain protein n=1 Tax=Aneurinibacillus soli TaxID=1500254 RepID=A0A0U5B4Z7_9BACL|nr:tail fiber protein [Aneurinibacillus soli]PYE60852.1 microcystin-dependent protein [Aneurinibacillus soli]BAU26758.1 Phage Tail Collar Domain protein [Aneurinibacillus soli]
MDAFIGTILPWSVSWAPRNWLPCDGRELNVNQYQALYSLIGFTYGGNGTTTFNLPDLRGRVPIGMGQQSGNANFVIGTNGGDENSTLTINQLPAHAHTFSGTANVHAGAPANTNAPTTNTPAANTSLSVAKDSTGDVANIYNTNPPTMMTATMNVTTTVIGTTAVSGNGQSFTNMQPYQVINYIICVVGLYPQRP